MHYYARHRLRFVILDIRSGSTEHVSYSITIELYKIGGPMLNELGEPRGEITLPSTIRFEGLGTHSEYVLWLDDLTD